LGERQGIALNLGVIGLIEALVDRGCVVFNELGGGIIGIFLGIAASYGLELATGIETILSVNSIILSFFVATFIGLAFGVLPAKSAANKNPIEAIRRE